MSKKKPRKKPGLAYLPTRADRESARTDLIGVKVTAEEKELVRRVAEERGHASMADCLREAFNVYASMTTSELAKRKA